MRCSDRVGVRVPSFLYLVTPLLDVKFRMLLRKAPYPPFKELPESFLEMKYPTVTQPAKTNQSQQKPTNQS